MVYNLQTLAPNGNRPYDPNPTVRYGMRCVAQLFESGLLGRKRLWVSRCPRHSTVSRPPSRATIRTRGCSTNQIATKSISCLCTQPATRLRRAGRNGYIRYWNMNTKMGVTQYPPRMVSGQAIPVACGGFNPEGTLLAYALSYDWSLGRDSYSPQYPKAVMIKQVQPNAIAPS